jgi:hypothetical protein
MKPFEIGVSRKEVCYRSFMHAPGNHLWNDSPFVYIPQPPRTQDESHIGSDTDMMDLPLKSS